MEPRTIKKQTNQILVLEFSLQNPNLRTCILHFIDQTQQPVDVHVL